MTGNWEVLQSLGKKVSILTCWLPYFHWNGMGHADQYAQLEDLSTLQSGFDRLDDSHSQP